MPLAPKHAKTINDIADLLYDFLPRKPHPYANQSISFQGVANEIGLMKFWTGGSKLPAINALLASTYEHEKGKFCNLFLLIVNKAIVYRSKKSPISRQEISALNDLILSLGFKIPELWDKDFLGNLAGNDKSMSDKSKAIVRKKIDYDALLQDFLALNSLEPHKRGFEFERFLNKLFDEFELNPRKSFRLTGEQIDGSLDLDGEYYLIEAKWQKAPLGNNDLLSFHGKVKGKSSWTRGIIISHNGFSKDGLEAFSRGRPTNLITLDGQDIYALLSKNIPFEEGLKTKVRWAAETGEIAKSVFELFV
jgi:hypothetical protein